MSLLKPLSPASFCAAIIARASRAAALRMAFLVLPSLPQAVLFAAPEPETAHEIGHVAPLVIPLNGGEKIWSGIIKDGHRQPYPDGYLYDFYANNQGNQLQPLLLGNQGLWVWSEEPYAFQIDKDRIVITRALGEVKHGRDGHSLAEARNAAAARFFPASGKMPDALLFSKPQYNTWIELTYNQNQADVLKYAKAIIDNGFEPGVLMIDDTWQEDYGIWDFHPRRFPQPEQMMRELHDMGFKVMLWICPFVSPDQASLMRLLLKDKALMMHKTSDQTTWETATEPAIIKWWNGHSALLDFTNPAAMKWFNGELDRLVRDYGIDGFKLDAGDMEFYPSSALGREAATPNRHCELYAGIGLRFPLNEYRACWKLAGKPLAQRLHDKGHNWDDLRKLIPHMLTEALAGYTFSCPDMIGGGDFISFLNLKSVDQNLVVRSAQIHALMPMMQFSVAPWRVLDASHLGAVKDAMGTRARFTPLILELAKTSAETGEPIISSLEYRFPNQGFDGIHDQFMLGDHMLVAPMVHPGTTRQVILPKGRWLADDGTTFEGGKTHTLEVSLNRIPWFRLQSE